MERLSAVYAHTPQVRSMSEKTDGTLVVNQGFHKSFFLHLVTLYLKKTPQGLGLLCLVSDILLVIRK